MSRVIGAIEEESAQKYLKAKGYSIVERNWRKGRAEIDIIALQEDTLVFIEVKFRKNKKFGLPEEKLSESQQNRILEAAENYLIEKIGMALFGLTSLQLPIMIYFIWKMPSIKIYA